ncbi:hypothetical protein L484_000096 [Morus notabilis]|uniref:Uncharacterized protein n=1 Tax=Morus notabilis TaxID=981085 RepID=W9QVL5_9ROSA|nr:hypothetical protein L484_000096 [Morus notabilis]
MGLVSWRHSSGGGRARRELRYNASRAGAVTIPKVLPIPAAVVGQEESFDMMDDGPRYDTKRCLRSRGGCRARTEIRSIH